MPALTLAFIATVLKSISTVSEKQVLIKEDVKVYTTAFAMVIAFLSIPLLFFVGNVHLTNADILIIFVTSLVSVVSSMTAAYSIKKLDISESSALFALSPLLVTLFAVIFLHESLTTMQIMGIALAALGVYVLEHRFSHHLDTNILPENQQGPSVAALKSAKINHAFTYTMLVVSLFFFSIGSVADRYIIHHRGIHPFLALVVIQFFILFNLIIFDLATMKNMRNKIVNPRIFLKISFWINIVVILCHRIVHTLAVSGMEASLLNAIKQLNAVFTSIIGGRFFTEKHLMKRALGCVLITAGVLIVIVWRL